MWVGGIPFTPPLTPETLAGLAVEPGVAARVVTYAATADGDGGDGGGTYTPATDDLDAALAAFPDEGGSLLVAGTEALVPPLAGGLLGSWAGLVSGWRTGDVMVSYASAGGTVGPHVDSYDVFLVAGSGCREWRVAYEPLGAGAEVEVPHCPLRVLAGPGGGVFTHPRADRWVSYTVAPGDVVHVPRRHPHWGVSVGPEGGMTYSVGLRAPSAADVARAYVADVADDVVGTVGVADPVATMVAALTPPWAAAAAAAGAAAGGGVAASTAVDELGEPLMDALWAATVGSLATAGRHRFGDWARRELTAPKGALEEVPPRDWDDLDAGAARDAAVATAVDALLSSPAGGGVGGGAPPAVGLRRRVGSVLAYAAPPGGRGGGATLYANGDAFSTPSAATAATAAGLWRVGGDGSGGGGEVAAFVATVGRQLAEALLAAGVWVLVDEGEGEWDGVVDDADGWEGAGEWEEEGGVEDRPDGSGEGLWEAPFGEGR